MSAQAQLPSRLPIWRETGTDSSGPLIILLHGEGQDISELAAFARDLCPARELLIPIGAWGTYVGAMDLSAYTWFHEVPGVGEPEPISFGRSLFDVEQLLLAQAPQGGVVLVGIEQGATLARTLAGVLPDLLAAVVAIGGKEVTLPDGALLDVPATDPVPLLSLEVEGDESLSQDVSGQVSTWLKETEGGS